MCNVMAIRPLGLYGCAHWCNKHSQNLQTLELSNQLADSLKIKLIETVLACRYATSWSFAHLGHMGDP